MIIAHDLGTSGDKASLHDDSGITLATATVGYPAAFASGGVAEQDPDDWWRAVGEATRQVLARAGVDARHVDAVGLSGQMMGAVLLGPDDRPLRPAFIWADQRSTAQVDALLARVPQADAYAELGHRLNPTYTLPKVMWVRDNEPDVWARVRHVCLAKDHVTLRLTGRLATDPSDASGTDAYELVEGRWSARLLDAAGIDPGLFPEVVPSTTVLGGLTDEAADHTGLAPGTPVVVGGGDGPMASVGAGVTDPADGAYVSLGTSAWLALSGERPSFDPEMRTFTFAHVVPGRYVPIATMQAGGACLQWIADVLEPDGGPDRFGRLLEAASTVPAAADGLFFLPHILGERSPYFNPAAAGVFAGIGRHHGPGHLVRAVLEGVAFNLRTCIGALESTGNAIESVDVIGGSARSDVWMAILADVWGIPVRRRSIVEEANSLGAAVTALVALGRAEFGIARGLSAITGEWEPDAERSAAYARAHDIFLDAYARLEPWFDDRLTASPPEPGGPR